MRKNTRWVPWLILTMLMLLTDRVIVQESFGYNLKVHLTLTAFLLRAAGMEPSMADQISQADQGMDDPSTDAWRSLEMRELYHFPTTARLLALRTEAMSRCDAASAGQYMHALEDSFAHQGFDAVLGHFWTPIPDWADWNVPRAMDMAERKYTEATAMVGSCPAFKGSSVATPWAAINGSVRNFLRDRTSTTISLQ
jgi:hypothetical protein